MLVNRLAI